MINEKDIPEFCGQLIDQLEDYLTDVRGVTPDMILSENPNDEHIAIICGKDYDFIADSIRDEIDAYPLQYKEFKFKPQALYYVVEHIYYAYSKVLSKIKDLKLSNDDVYQIKYDIVNTFKLWEVY